MTDPATRPTLARRLANKALRTTLAGADGTLGRLFPLGWTAENLRKPGFAPATVIDVGVAGGTPPLYEAFPDAYHVLVEPLTEFRSALRDVLETYQGEHVEMAVGEHEGELTMHVDSGALGRSSLHERTALTTRRALKPPTDRPVPVTTLDNLLDERAWEPPYGLKIDTEGHEMAVLRGAERVLKDTEFVIAEVSVTPRFVNGYAFHELVAWLADRGFELYDILDATRHPDAKHLFHLDGWFRRAEAGAGPGTTPPPSPS